MNMKNWNTYADKGKAKLSNTYLLQGYSTHHKFHMESESKLGLQGKKPATNRLSRDTASQD